MAMNQEHPANEKLNTDAQLSEKLHDHGLRSTRHRKALLRLLIKRAEALEQSQISELLEEEMDRATLYRSLRQLEESGLLHKVAPEKGSPRYAYCGHACTIDQHRHDHVHFTCNQCRRTFCMEHTGIPEVNMPTGYQVVDWQFHLSGICPDCRDV